MSAWQAIVPSTQTGPQFALRFYVDPYRPERLFVLDGSNIWRSGDGGQSWWEETALEAALTENGVYPFTIPPNATPNDALLQDMQFDPDDPNTMYATGPAGTFYSVDGINWYTLVNCTALCARPMGLFYDRISHPVTRSLYMEFAYRGLLKLSQLPVPLLEVNITAITQQKCTDQLASWRTAEWALHGGSHRGNWARTRREGFLVVATPRLAGRECVADCGTPATPRSDIVAGHAFRVQRRALGRR